MTVTANTTRNDYTAGSAQSVYNYTFQLNDAADVDVYLDGVKQTLNTHYTVQNVDNATGGTITFTLVDANNNPIHPTQGAVINIVMAMDLDRDTNYQPSGAFLASTVNNDFDRLWHSTNQQQTAINRSLRLQDTDVTTSSMELPLKDARKGKLLAFNASTGDPEATSNNQSNWDAAYNDKINSAAFSGSTLTLTQQDGGTVTASHTPYLPLTGGTVSGDVEFGANKAKFLTLEIYTTIGFNSIIEETGSGNLFIKGDDLRFQTPTNEDIIKGVADGGVTLYYNNSPKLETTNNGITVTGDLKLGDNDRVTFGASDDLEIYHSPQASYIEEKDPASSLFIKGSALVLGASGESGNNYIEMGGSNDPVTLKYDNNPRLTTTNAGITVTGTLTATGYNDSNWNTAYNNHITGVNFSGSTLTLTQQDGGTLTTTINGNIGQWTTNGSNIHYSSGSVGIGTPTPAEALHVTGNIAFGNTAPAELYTNSAELRLGVDKNNDNGSSDITFYTNDDEKVRINKDGKVGIGTTRSDSLFCIGSNANSVSGTMNIQHQTNAGHKIVAKDTDSSTAFSASVIDMDVSGDQAITGSQVYHRGLNIDVDSTATGGTTTNEHRLYGIDSNVTATGDSDLIYGINAHGVTTSTGSGDNNQNTQVQGANFTGSNQSSGDAIVLNTYGAKFVSFNKSTSSDATARNNFGSVSESILHADATKKTNFRGAYNKVDIRETTNASDVGTVHGTYSGIFNNQTSNVTLDDNQTLFYGSYHGTEGKVTAANRIPYGVYIPSNVVNYFEGNVGIGVDDPQDKLDVNGTVRASDLYITGGESYLCRTHATTNASLSVLRLCAISTGDMADGFGTGITFDAQDNSGTTQSQVAEINAVRAGADNVFNLELQTGDVARLTLGTNGATFATGTSGTDRLKIDSSGNVGINTGANTISEKLEVTGNIKSTGTVTATKYHGSAGSNYNPTFSFTGSTVTGMYQPASGSIAFCTNTSERMRINSAGNVGIGTSSIGAKLHVNGQARASTFYATGNGSQIHNAGFMGGSGLLVKHNQTSTNYQNMIEFKNGSYATVGKIQSNNGGTQYVTTSDRRLKENIQDANDAGSKIDAIQIRQFDWKEGGEHQDFGVIAQELQAVAPEAVSEGYTEDDMMGVDYSKLVPTLIKEIQSLRTRVAQLENN